LLSGTTNALRKIFLIELETYGVVPRIDKIGEVVRHTQYKKNRRIASDSNVVIASFDPD
jgi:hypothetical protein